MSVVDMLFLALPCLTFFIGVGVGMGRKDTELRENAKQVNTDVDEDGCWSAWWLDGRTHGAALTETPWCLNRCTSRGIAKRILERQGEDGAKVAQEVFDAYRRQTAAVPDDKAAT